MGLLLWGTMFVAACFTGGYFLYRNWDGLTERQPVVSAIEETPQDTETPGADESEPQATELSSPSPQTTSSITLLPTAMLNLPAAPKEIKIAILAPLSGPVPTFGVSTRDGALLAIEEWNARGGVLGAKIVAIVEDSQCRPDPAVDAAKRVIDQDHVKYIVGEVCSSASIPVSEIANARGVVMISPTSANPAVTADSAGNVKPYIFRVCYDDFLQGRAGADFALKNLAARTAFILRDPNNNYVSTLAEIFEQAFVAGGGVVVGKEVYAAKDTDFSTLLAKVADARPDVVYLPDYYNIVNLMTRQAKEKGITALFLGGDGWDSPDLDLNAADGGYFSNHFSLDDPRPLVQDFIRSYGVWHKDQQNNPKTPDALAALAYDATNLLLQAIHQTGMDDPVRVKDVLAGMNYTGVSGEMSFDPDHIPLKSVVFLKVNRDQVSFFDAIVPAETTGEPGANIANTPPPSPTPARKATATATPGETDYCPGTYVSRLRVGDRARVTTDPYLANRVRQRPSLSAKHLGNIQPGEPITILDGPECNLGIWWYVRSDRTGLTGWTLEGDEQDYWLEPR